MEKRNRTTAWHHHDITTTPSWHHHDVITASMRRVALSPGVFLHSKLFATPVRLTCRRKDNTSNETNFLDRHTHHIVTLNTKIQKWGAKILFPNKEHVWLFPLLACLHDKDECGWFSRGTLKSSDKYERCGKKVPSVFGALPTVLLLSLHFRHHSVVLPQPNHPLPRVRCEQTPSRNPFLMTRNECSIFVATATATATAGSRSFGETSCARVWCHASWRGLVGGRRRFREGSGRCQLGSGTSQIRGEGGARIGGRGIGTGDGVRGDGGCGGYGYGYDVHQYGCYKCEACQNCSTRMRWRNCGKRWTGIDYRQANADWGWRGVCNVGAWGIVFRIGRGEEEERGGCDIWQGWLVAEMAKRGLKIGMWMSGSLHRGIS